MKIINPAINHEISSHVVLYELMKESEGNAPRLICSHDNDSGIDSNLNSMLLTSKNPGDVLFFQSGFNILGNYKIDDLANPEPEMIIRIKKEANNGMPVIFCPAYGTRGEPIDGLFSGYVRK